MRARHQTCPHCHTPIAVDRFELACDGTNSYRVCPECDYTWCVTTAPDEAQMPAAAECQADAAVVVQT